MSFNEVVFVREKADLPGKSILPIEKEKVMPGAFGVPLGFLGEFNWLGVSVFNLAEKSAEFQVCFSFVG